MNLTHSELHKRIGQVERRLERRRTRLLHQSADATNAAADTATKVLPVAAALGAGLVALYFTRKLRRPPALPRTYSAFRDSYAEPRRGLRWAQLVGLVGTAVRIGTSPQARAFWHGFKRARQRKQQRSVY